MRENPQTQDSTCDLLDFSHFYPKSNIILWSIHTFWYKGSAENKKKKTKDLYFQKQQPKTQRQIFSKKLRYDVKSLILVRYHIILNI